jgi:hypothetical protein
MAQRTHRSRRLARSGAALAAAALGASAAAAEPMNLANPEPRAVWVRFEVSPPEHPTRTDALYSPALPAQLAPGPLPGQLSVTVPGRLVERHLLADHAPVPGSFSDFVWVFDAQSGHVRSARVSGVLVQSVRVGLGTWSVAAPIRIEMDTASPAGFEDARQLFGRSVHRFCVPNASRGCQAVAARPYDPATGYVNALGAISADSGLVQIRSFSPLGEAVFSEAEPTLAAESPPPVSLAPPAALLN